MPKTLPFKFLGYSPTKAVPSAAYDDLNSLSFDFVLFCFYANWDNSHEVMNPRTSGIGVYLHLRRSS